MAEMDYRTLALSGEEETQEFVATIQALERRNGVCSPDALLDAARAAGSESPMYKRFHFDDDRVAAFKWRKALAGAIIRRIKVDIVVRGRPVQTRAFQPVIRDGRRGYVSTSTVRGDPDLTEQVVRRVQRMLITAQKLCAEYSEVFEFDGLPGILDEAIAAAAKAGPKKRTKKAA